MRLTIKTTPDGLQVDIPDEEISAVLEKVLIHQNQPSRFTTEPSKTETPIDKEVLTVKEAAEFLNINKSSLYIWALQKRIPSVKVGRCRRFVKKELMDWFNKHKV